MRPRRRQRAGSVGSDTLRRYVVVAGNIGVGKSTLVAMLCERKGWSAYYEPVAENPYLEDFYRDMSHWAFHSQVFFLTHRAQSHLAISGDPHTVVQDRSLYEDAEVFARNLFNRGMLSAREWETYLDLYRTVVRLLPAPDLVVYLKASVPTLKRRIVQRGRGFEASISDDYLAQLNNLYEEWCDRFDLAPVLKIPCDRLDFVEESRDLRAIVNAVEERLRDRQTSLFPDEM